MTPKISIIMPNYNGARHLRDALDSVLAQTFSDWECIVIDDGSTDSSIDIIKEYKDSRFVLIGANHRGVSAARNAGLDSARGEWIAFLDSDDCYTRTALEMLYNAAMSYGADIVGGRMMHVPENYKFIKTDEFIAAYPVSCFDVTFENIINNSKAHRFPWIWRRIFRRSIISDIRFPEHIYREEDACWLMGVWLNARRAVEVGGYVYKYRNNVRECATNQNVHNVILVCRYIESNFTNRYPQFFWKYFFTDYMNYFISDCVWPFWKEKRKIDSDVFASLRRIYRSPAMPRKYVSRKNRFRMWLMGVR